MTSVAIGEVVRELRRARGWSQGRLASEINDAFATSLTREYVSGWERGKVRPGPFYVRCLSSVLDVPPAVLEQETARQDPALQGLTGGVATASVAPQLAADLLAVGFTARLRGGPSPQEWEEKLTAYGADYMSLGAADIQRRAAHDLMVVQQQLDDDRMWSVAARLMTLYATTFTWPDQAKAVAWFRMAAEAADRSDDVRTRVWTRGRAALTLGYGGKGLGYATVLADQAMAISDKPSAGLLNATLGKAYALALQGDKATALDLADRARRVFDASGPSTQVSDYAVAHWRLNGFLSLLSARLGDEDRAIRAQEAARRELPASLPRFAAHLDMHTALMLTRSGDKAGGHAHAHATLDALPREKHCGTLRMLLEEIEA
ncbi:helix-turn-helix transcriptional regulator [Streptomyces griseocarneus]|uniref:Helix-turn-helix transcriptional regulator n=1 Tax=Streptomyces griseocarneus TaxID=51201 RepID=A0ABX7RKE8_9ACTN|nr:helix-turn-helix transcriptional regulator [Streptomyces griseocarneus]